MIDNAFSTHNAAAPGAKAKELQDDTRSSVFGDLDGLGENDCLTNLISRDMPFSQTFPWIRLFKICHNVCLGELEEPRVIGNGCLNSVDALGRYYISP